MVLSGPMQLLEKITKGNKNIQQAYQEIPYNNSRNTQYNLHTYS